ncbi:MAG: NAD(P)-dependent oxidoreductase [Candidatus Latescibacteria bacterium]|nr:NAD(P)-dependent oxidoreductase [Candidatus Latescibacterota bacterium]
MNIAVFGAAGWLGRAIIENLAAHHDVRAVDRNPDAWEEGGPWQGGEIVHADIADFDSVRSAMDEMDAVVHAAVYHGPYSENDDQPFLVNLKGLWNTLENARACGIRRIVHIGSCQVEHPDGIFFTADVRRPDGSLYAVAKRLQEEMCRQFYDAFNLPIVVLRPSSIIDSRTDLLKGGVKLESGSWNVGMVCRHDIAEACRLALERTEPNFEVLHVAGSSEASSYCNVEETCETLGMKFRGDLEKYR